MSYLGGPGGDVHRPYFFLSYAHTPGTRSGGLDPNHWVHRLHQDLCDSIMEITALPADVPAGFMDRGMHLGERWEERLAEALARCRVFVPLYSPRYFRSEYCGREWQGFAGRRVRRTAGSSHHSAIVPVWWVRVPSESLPPVASRLQFNHSEFGADYLEEGMHALIKLRYFRESYELAVHRLANRIVQVAEQTVIEDGLLRDFTGLRSAFAAPAPARRLRISVLSCDTTRLPEGRSAATYGPSQLDWEPYQPSSSSPLVQHVESAAQKLNFHTSVHLFEDEAPELTSSSRPNAPGLLLLDRWALLDPERRELVKQLDAANPGWVSVMEPWSVNDPDNAKANGRLLELSDSTLTHKHEVRPSLQGAFHGLPTLSDFDAELPLAARRAMAGFEEAVRDADPPEALGRARPRLKEALDGPLGNKPNSTGDNLNDDPSDDDRTGGTR